MKQRDREMVAGVVGLQEVPNNNELAESATTESPTETAGNPGPCRTLADLIRSYQTARGSSYHELRYHTRIRHEQMLRRIRDRHGDVPLSSIRAMTIKEWHLDWSANKTKIATGHSFVAQLRTLVGFGILAHEDAECTRLGAARDR